MKLKLLLIFGSLTLVFSKSVPIESVARGYHSRIGIPEAQRIKTIEDQLVKNPERIVGGDSALVGQFPYQAGLIITLSNGLQSICGATLLSHTALVSAAHCWWDGTYLANSYEVVLGSNLLYYGGTRVTATRVVMHIFYNIHYMNNDISIITVPYVEYSSLIQPINLPSDINENFENDIAVTSGYGRTYEGSAITTGQTLNYVNLRVISNHECVLVFGGNVVIDSTICTSGEGGIGTCDGDSGGPLVVERDGQPELIGVSSFGTEYGCEYGAPSGFVRVTSFKQWIMLNADL